MYTNIADFSDYRTTENDDSLLPNDVFSSAGDVLQPRTKSCGGGCKCGGKCKKNGVGDLSTFFSDPASLFTDSSTGGISWTTVAIAGAAAVAGYMLLFGNTAQERRSELSRARTDYNRKRASILAKFPRYAV